MGIGKKITKIFLLAAFISAATLSGAAYADSGLSFSMQDVSDCNGLTTIMSTSLTRNPSEGMYDYCYRVYIQNLMDETGATNFDELGGKVLESLKPIWDIAIDILLTANPKLQSDREYHEELADAYIEAYFKYADDELLAPINYVRYNIIKDGESFEVFGSLELNGQDLKLYDCSSTGDSCTFYNDEFGTITIDLSEDNGIVTAEYTVKNTANTPTDFNIQYHLQVHFYL